LSLQFALDVDVDKNDGGFDIGVVVAVVVLAVVKVANASDVTAETNSVANNIIIIDDER
jgi:hypothetical protein